MVHKHMHFAFIAALTSVSARFAVGKYPSAVALYTQAIELHPTAIFLANRAMAYIRMESYGLAIADADRAIE